MDSILFIGNGFDIAHCYNTQIKDISSYRNLKKEVKLKNEIIYDKINSTNGIDNDWQNIEETEFNKNLEKNETEELLKIVKNWAKNIDNNYIANKDYLYDSSFQNFLSNKNLLFVSLNYTKLLTIVYEIKKENYLELHTSEDYAYIDGNNIYDDNNRKAKFGLPKLSLNQSTKKVPIGKLHLREFLNAYLQNDNEIINIYVFGLSFSGNDFKYFEELFNNEISQNLNTINVYLRKHQNVQCDKNNIRTKIENFFKSYNKPYNTTPIEEIEDDWLHLKYEIKIGNPF
ncbi:bacteriophage abortive infection AbiH family protein [Staphylococcus aureus]|uniref:bacteriophage abortive infection AbiH family protein n=1 Tax=Staphylococcus aureus TaxID=1280 RepID=UPI00215D07B5|nr:bacteriophage abortive infection AbiH family protein [Staphylococcus aureus]UVI86645.1 bacteriophage abortive infection AbiH family protein [Staphylococcus aureus]UVJ27800.1 bacteriophage abortive infection AbiH family protein [Staphylococcus aureus]